MTGTFPDLTLFDLDKTLLASDSDFEWGVFLCDTGVVDKSEYLRRNEVFYQQYRAGQLDINAYLRFALAPLAATPPERLETLRTEFIANRIEPLVLRAGLKLVEKHQRAGDLTVIITATNRFITEPIAERFGVRHLIATEPECRQGRFTGAVTGSPCFREGKLKCLRLWLDRERPDYGRTRFYSDSFNDLPLLSWVDEPVVVDGDSELRAHAQAENWPMISLRDDLTGRVSGRASDKDTSRNPPPVTDTD